MMRPLAEQNAQNDISKNPCKLCKPFNKKPFCICPKGGSGGDGGAKGGGNHSSNKENSPKSVRPVDLLAPSALSNSGETAEPAIYFNKENDPDKKFDMEIIRSLLDKQILSIENNDELGILHIKCNPALHALLSETEKSELHKFLYLLQKEFNEFKNKNSILSKDCSISLQTDNQGNIFSLTITIRDHDLYDEFIKHLASNFIASPANKKLKNPQEENTDENRKSTYSSPNPLNIDNGPINI